MTSEYFGIKIQGGNRRPGGPGLPHRGSRSKNASRWSGPSAGLQRALPCPSTQTYRRRPTARHRASQGPLRTCLAPGLGSRLVQRNGGKRVARADRLRCSGVHQSTQLNGLAQVGQQVTRVFARAGERAGPSVRGGCISAHLLRIDSPIHVYTEGSRVTWSNTCQTNAKTTRDPSQSVHRA